MNRLVRVPTSVDGVLAIEPRPTVVDLGGAGAVRLQIDQPGRLDALTVHAVKRIPPQDDQVEVRVVAAGSTSPTCSRPWAFIPRWTVTRQ